MKFSLWNFKDWFDRESIELSYMINHTAADITGLSSPEYTEASDSGNALIISGDKLTDCSGFHSVLQYGRDRILFPTASPAEVWNHCSAMIEHYTEWEGTLLTSIETTHSLSALFIQAQREFPFPMALLLKNGTVYRKTDDFELKLNERSVRELLRQVLDSSGNEPVCRSFRFDPLQTYMASPVLFEEIPSAIMISYEKERRFQPGFFPVFQSIVSAVQAYYQFYSEIPQKTHPLSGWLYQTLDPGERESPDLDTRLLEAGWNKNDYYQIACLEARPGCPPSVLQDAALQLADNSRCCVTVNNKLTVLCRLGEEFPRQASSFGTPLFALGECIAGVSLPFRSLNDLRPYYRQAMWALQHASRMNTDCLETIAQLPEYLKEICKGLPEGNSLIHPDILRLAEADDLLHEDLLKTLYTYYICGNSQSRTANALFIHRNTLRLRLKKIRSVLNTDPEDPQVSSQYLLSLLLLK